MASFNMHYDLSFVSVIYLLEFLFAVNREKRIVEEGYDAIAEEYARARRKTSRGDMKYLRLFFDHVPQGSKVLDFSNILL